LFANVQSRPEKRAAFLLFLGLLSTFRIQPRSHLFVDIRVICWPLCWPLGNTGIERPTNGAV
jgi:hypothetical protein